MAEPAVYDLIPSGDDPRAVELLDKQVEARCQRIGIKIGELSVDQKLRTAVVISRVLAGHTNQQRERYHAQYPHIDPNYIPYRRVPGATEVNIKTVFRSAHLDQDVKDKLVRRNSQYYLNDLSETALAYQGRYTEVTLANQLRNRWLDQEQPNDQAAACASGVLAAYGIMIGPVEERRMHAEVESRQAQHNYELRRQAEMRHEGNR